MAKVAQIAKANNIPKKFLDQIFTDLRNIGLVHSARGRCSGYALAKPANKIRVGQIIRAINGPIARISHEHGDPGVVFASGL